MATLHDLSKEQLVELLVLATEVSEKEVRTIQYLITQMKQKPNHLRITIDLPIKEISRDYRNLKIESDRIDFEIAFKSSNPNKLFSVIKKGLEFDLNIYTI
ncbi:MAG: hypothetical protein HC836_31100 [Richelia sp. RM2_1_2]|nr:hypothetical protein [Richelia sp. RM2_1_2]